ncbi:MAG TPA: LPS export ABC transporter permease LptF [Burkholderiaceae bacterium]|jgi:lipopolysaccharide export system permease protein|nr:LPS export ABC transporter permease LptF [Burkholderiaceae bacterium]
MLFDSTVRKEVARSFGATLMVLLTIVLTNFLIRTLGLAANGAVSPQDVVLVLAFFALQNLPTVLALSLFVGIVLSLGRMYRESEMAIWFASGVGLWRFVWPVARTSWPVLVVIGGLMIWVWPWSNQQSNDIRVRYEQRSDVMRAAPGQFQTSADGHRVFFVEKAGDEQTGGGRNVFIVSDLPDKESVAVSESGKVETVGDERVLVLGSGHMQQVDKQSGEHTHVSFEHYRVHVGETTAPATGTPSPRVMATADLLRVGGRGNLGEFTWRVGLIVGAVNLLLLGIGLSSTNPRRASNWSLVFALLAFIIYYNLLNLTQAWVADGRLTMPVAIGGLHGGALAAGMLLIWWRDHASVIHPFRLLARRSAA